MNKIDDYLDQTLKRRPTADLLTSDLYFSPTFSPENSVPVASHVFAFHKLV